jgi:hypothetical protein
MRPPPSLRYQTDHLLRRLNLADGARDERLEHGPAVVVEEVDFVHDDQPHQLRVRPCAVNPTPSRRALSPLLRVMMSHFSGVVTMICVSAI